MSIEGQGHFFTYFFKVLCFTRPRYQVSVYRTIGPLVFCSNYDTGLTLTYFMARSNFATKVLYGKM